MVWRDRDVDALLRMFGADADGGFLCPVPGHAGRALIGVPPDDPDEDFRVLCCHGRWRSLGEVRAAMAYGSDQLRTNIELAVWTRRLAHEAGAFAPLDVPMPELPQDARLAAHRARAGFKLLLGLRWADGEHRPAAFAVRFTAAWCSMSHADAQRGVRDLVDLGVIRETDRVGKVRLYLPGAVSSRSHLRVAAPLPTSGNEQALVDRIVREFAATEEPNG